MNTFSHRVLPMSQAEDLILVGQVTLLGSRRAFDTLVRKYQGDVQRLLLNLTGGDADLRRTSPRIPF